MTIILILPNDFYIYFIYSFRKFRVHIVFSLFSGLFITYSSSSSSFQAYWMFSQWLSTLLCNYCNICWSIVLEGLSSRCHKAVYCNFQPTFLLKHCPRWYSIAIHAVLLIGWQISISLLLWYFFLFFFWLSVSARCGYL